MKTYSQTYLMQCTIDELLYEYADLDCQSVCNCEDVEKLLPIASNMELIEVALACKGHNIDEPYNSPPDYYDFLAAGGDPKTLGGDGWAMLNGIEM